jgi:hypothetical protein
VWYLLKVEALVAGVVFAGAAMIILVLLAWPKEKPSKGGSAATRENDLHYGQRTTASRDCR